MCSNCHKELPAYARFCDGCGMQVVPAASESMEDVLSSPAEVMPAAQSAEEDMDTKPLPAINIEPLEQPAAEQNRHTEDGAEGRAAAAAVGVSGQAEPPPPLRRPEGYDRERASSPYDAPYGPPQWRPQEYCRAHKPWGPVLSLGQAVGFVLIALIPIVNFIMMCVWAFGGSGNPSRQNMARAVLIVELVLTAMLIAAFFTAVIILSRLNYGLIPKWSLY